MEETPISQLNIVQSPQQNNCNKPSAIVYIYKYTVFGIVAVVLILSINGYTFNGSIKCNKLKANVKAFKADFPKAA